jgi:N-acyl-D-amino-acid deacylase
MTLDKAIINGTIIDGSGTLRHTGSVGIKGSRIVSVDEDVGLAQQIIDADGLVVAPGFIDIHTHSCAALLADPRGLSAVSQGVTTHVVGNCGNSVFPAAELMRPLVERFGVEYTWTDLRGYESRIRERGIGVNVATLVGHGTVRALVMGEDARTPKPEELEAMKRLIAQAMKDGAFGLSTGLIYAPGCFSNTEELVELARVVDNFGGFYATHMRNEGDGLVDAVEEAISIGERAGVPVQISHLKAVSRRWWGRVGEVLKNLDKARARGVDVTWDQYPYTATSTGLQIFIPDWAHEGGTHALKKRLRAHETSRRILAEMRQSGKDWSQVLIIACSGHPEWQNLTPVEIGTQLGRPPEEAVIEILLAENSEVKMANFAMCEEDIETIMRHPTTIVGSDGVAVAAEGPLDHLRFHPRSYGTFPRVLGRYVREKEVLTLEEAVRKMTAAPARRLGLHDRGLLREGMRADITVFDPARIADRATFSEPQRYSEGIEHVLVNGEFVIKQACCTGKLPGVLLLKNSR